MATFTASYGPVIDSTTPQTNPQTTDILADSGPMQSGMYEVRVTCGCTVAAVFQFEHRNAANDANVTDPIVIRAAAGQTGEYVFKYHLNTNERVRVRPQANITGGGEASVSLFRVV